MALATHSSAKKAGRQAERRHLRNNSVRSVIKTYVRKAERLIATDNLTEADPAVLQAVQVLDSAAQKGVIHRNRAARSKSRLLHKYNAAKLADTSN